MALGMYLGDLGDLSDLAVDTVAAQIREPNLRWTRVAEEKRTGGPYLAILNKVHKRKSKNPRLRSGHTLLLRVFSRVVLVLATIPEGLSSKNAMRLVRLPK
jgi:hypothetical protein